VSSAPASLGGETRGVMPAAAAAVAWWGVWLVAPAQVAYMEITSETLPMAIGEPVVSELRPAVQSIDATQNMRDFVERCERRAPVIEPGTQQLVEYRPLEVRKRPAAPCCWAMHGGRTS
jgi:hypothetical protein